MLEKNLNELNIFALRDLARKAGVSSPTSKKKEELIREIVEINSGRKQPEIKSKQGRPPKIFGYDFANVFNTINQNNSIVSFNQNCKVFSDDDVKTVAGWLEPINNNSAILWINTNSKMESYFVSKDLLKNVNIKLGDRAVAEISFENNQQVIKQIFSINNCPISQFEQDRVEFSNLEHLQLNKELMFDKKEYASLKLKVAENIYIYGENNKDNSQVAIDMVKSCNAANKLYLNISLVEKNKSMLSGLEGVEKFVVYIETDADIVRTMIMLAIERAKRLVENGEDVVLFVDDMLSVSAVDKENLNLVKKLVSITKQANKGSLTLVAIMPNEKLISIEKLADLKLKIINNKIQKY